MTKATLIPLSDAAEMLGVAHSTLALQARRGKLKAQKVGPVWVVSPAEVERYRSEHLGRFGLPSGTKLARSRT